MRKRHLLSYLAGLFDGEGSISITRSKERGRMHPQHYLRAEVTNTHRGVVELFRLNFGGTIETVYPKSPKHYPYFKWLVSKTETIEFLKTMLPYLLIKRPQAEIAFEFVKEFNPSKDRSKPTEETLAMREANRILMQEANRSHIKGK